MSSFPYCLFSYKFWGWEMYVFPYIGPAPDMLLTGPAERWSKEAHL